MKRLMMALLVLLVLLSLSAAVRPSVDGRAVVAEEGTLPTGLYAKAAGFFPNEAVLVTNPATGDKIDLLVVETLEPREGIAILLSPEAASRLFIAKNSNSLVSVTKSSAPRETLPEMPREAPLKITR
jgi:hypothetical protein